MCGTTAHWTVSHLYGTSYPWLWKLSGLYSIVLFCNIFAALASAFNCSASIIVWQLVSTLQNSYTKIVQFFFKIARRQLLLKLCGSDRLDLMKVSRDN